MQDHLSHLLQIYEKQNTRSVYKTLFETKKSHCQSSEAGVWFKMIKKRLKHCGVLTHMVKLNEFKHTYSFPDHSNSQE